MKCDVRVCSQCAYLHFAVLAVVIAVVSIVFLVHHRKKCVSPLHRHQPQPFRCWMLEPVTTAWCVLWVHSPFVHCAIVRHFQCSICCALTRFLLLYSSTSECIMHTNNMLIRANTTGDLFTFAYFPHFVSFFLIALYFMDSLKLLIYFWFV